MEIVRIPTTKTPKPLQITNAQPNPEECKSTIKKKSSSSPAARRHEEKNEDESPQLLHSGPTLGDLPSLTGHRMRSPDKTLNTEVDAVLREARSPISPTANNLSNNFDNMNINTNTNSNANTNLSRRADGKSSKKKKSKRNDVPDDMPKEYLCALTKRPMNEPVKSTFGHVYDKSAIMRWFSEQGRICPLSGMCIHIFF